MPRIATGAPIERPQATRAEKSELGLNPRVLHEAINTLVAQYAVRGDIEEQALPRTPDITVKISDEDEVTVFAGYAPGDRRNYRCIFLVNPETNEMVEWICAALDRPTMSLVIQDGHGETITSTEELQLARRLIDAMAQEYHRAAVEAADTLDIQQFIINDLDDEINQATELIAKLQAEREVAVTVPQPTAFRVAIRDAWEREGGKSLDQVFVTSSLSQALEEAVAQFKVNNQRSDVQWSSFSVYVTADGSTWHDLPSDVIMPLGRALCAYDSEASALNRPQTT